MSFKPRKLAFCQDLHMSNSAARDGDPQVLCGCSTLLELNLLVSSWDIGYCMLSEYTVLVILDHLKSLRINKLCSNLKV